jgi:hypothetical protein
VRGESLGDRLLPASWAAGLYLSVRASRDLVRPETVVGCSASTDGQLRFAASTSALIGYVGIGALRATLTVSMGTDPTGGTGIQAAHTSIAANGGYGMTGSRSLRRKPTLRSVNVPTARVHLVTQRLNGDLPRTTFA